MLRSKTLNLQLSPLAALILAAGLPACSGPSPNDGGAGGGSGCLSSCPVAACGQLPDGCGGVLNCGSCAAGMTCGAGGVPNVCAPACARGCPRGFGCDARGICAGDGGSLTIDVPTVRVRAVVKVNGTSPTVAPPPSFTLPTSAASALSLRERSSDSVLALTAACTAAVGQPCPLTFEGTVYPGDYRVGLGAARLVELPEAASNRLDLLDRFSIELAPSLRIEAADAGLNYDVTTRTLQVTLTVNGAAPTNASGSPTAVSVVLVETTTGAEVELTAPCSTPMGQPCPLTTTAALPPGTYRATKLSTGLVEGLPFFANELTFDGPTVTVTPTQTTLSIDLQSYSVRGKLTVNGSAVMPSAPTLRITDLDGGTATVVSLPCLNPGACDPRFSFSLVRGTYRVIAETTLIDPSTRFNGSHVVHEALVVTQPLASFDVDLKTVDVTGTLTVNGFTPTNASAAGSIWLSFTDPQQPLNRSSFAFGCDDRTPAGPCPLSFSGSVFAGPADVTASPSQLNGVPERLTSGSLARLSLNADSGVALDLRTRALSTSITVNGQAPTVAGLADGGVAAPWATLVLTTPAGEEMAVQALECPIRSIGAQCPLTFRAPVYDGVSYRAALTGNGFRELPLTTAQPFQWSLTRRLPVPAPITVPAPPSLNVSTARLKGTVTLNGQTPMLSAADAGLGSSATVPVARLNLTRLDTGAATAVSLFCGAASAPGRCVLDFDTWVSPGVYRVGVEPLSSAVADTPVGARRRYQAYDAVELR